MGVISSSALNSLLRSRRTTFSWLGGFLAAVSLSPALADNLLCKNENWPLWQAYAARYVQDDGRMLESSVEPNHSTSEGQSYGMLFALVANDPQRFESLWKWTAANLAGADINIRLPGWLWGRGKDEQWQLQDANSASDADLWMAYSLLEAARVWQRPDYHDDALGLLKTIESKLVMNLPGLGKMVIPGPEGFVLPDHLWRLNPSYLPIPLLRRLAKEAPNGPWKEVAENTVKLVKASSPEGYVADWVGYRATGPKEGLFVVDPVKGDLGSYDAIRVYLWAGMTPKSDPLAGSLMSGLNGMSLGTGSTGFPPESVQTQSGALKGLGPFGFSAALIPYFEAKGQPWLADIQRHRVEESLNAALLNGENPSSQPLYYNTMLSLFALGWAEKRYQFRDDGTLKMSWETPCVRAETR